MSQAPAPSATAPTSSAESLFDYIVIGAGTAGALMANRLSADPKRRVLLIEAGRKDDYHWIHIPVRYLRGKTLGGCSSINGMIYMRGQARDYEHWAELTGDDAWRWQQVLPEFMRHEDHWRLDAPGQAPSRFEKLHGHRRTGSTGEWRVEKQRLRWDILDAFAQAAQQAGVPASDDFNQGSNEGVGYFEVNQKS